MPQYPFRCWRCGHEECRYLPIARRDEMIACPKCPGFSTMRRIVAVQFEVRPPAEDKQAKAVEKAIADMKEFEKGSKWIS